VEWGGGGGYGGLVFFSCGVGPGLLSHNFRGVGRLRGFVYVSPVVGGGHVGGCALGWGGWGGVVVLVVCGLGGGGPCWGGVGGVGWVVGWGWLFVGGGVDL